MQSRWHSFPSPFNDGGLESSLQGNYFLAFKNWAQMLGNWARLLSLKASQNCKTLLDNEKNKTINDIFHIIIQTKKMNFPNGYYHSSTESYLQKVIQDHEAFLLYTLKL